MKIDKDEKRELIDNFNSPPYQDRILIIARDTNRKRKEVRKYPKLDKYVIQFTGEFFVNKNKRLLTPIPTNLDFLDDIRDKIYEILKEQMIEVFTQNHSEDNTSELSANTNNNNMLYDYTTKEIFTCYSLNNGN